MRDLDLTSVRAKLARAEEHVDLLWHEIDRWQELNPYAVIGERNEEATCWTWRLHVVHVPPFERWSLLLGDALHNLRCALDHLMRNLLTRESLATVGDLSPQLNFPICREPKDFTKAVTNHAVLGKLSPLVRTAIEQVQPFNRLPLGSGAYLTVLQRLNNADKHRAMTLAYGAATEGRYDTHGVKSGEFGIVGAPLPDRLEDGAEIGRLTCAYPAPHMNPQLHLTAAVAIEDRPGHRTSLAALVMLVRTEVRDVVEVVAAAVK